MYVFHCTRFFLVRMLLLFIHVVHQDMCYMTSCSFSASFSICFCFFNVVQSRGAVRSKPTCCGVVRSFTRRQFVIIPANFVLSWLNAYAASTVFCRQPFAFLGTIFAIVFYSVIA